MQKIVGSNPISRFERDPAIQRDFVVRVGRSGNQNEANHEIPEISRVDAEDVLSFTEMLLKVNYEMPARAAGEADAAES
jgi:hypothetical protein